MDLKGYQNVTVFDKAYPKDVQAEGIAVNHAVVYGHCDSCCFLATCEKNENFKPPFFAWCQQEKKRILENWNHKEEAGHGK